MVDIGDEQVVIVNNKGTGEINNPRPPTLSAFSILGPKHFKNVTFSRRYAYVRILRRVVPTRLTTHDSNF